MRAPSKPERRAIKVLEKCGINQLPIPVDRIASELGAKVAYEPFEGDVSGMLVRGNGSGAVIGVNSAHSNTRQRFTVAHEIAHLLIHTGRPMFVDSFVRVNWRNGESNQVEMEANAFAAELLMPRRLIEDQVQQAVERDPTLTPEALSKRLARTFKVSPQAMGYRLENLGVLGPLDLFV